MFWFDARCSQNRERNSAEDRTATHTQISSLRKCLFKITKFCRTFIRRGCYTHTRPIIKIQFAWHNANFFYEHRFYEVALVALFIFVRLGLYPSNWFSTLILNPIWTRGPRAHTHSQLALFNNFFQCSRNMNFFSRCSCSGFSVVTTTEVSSSLVFISPNFSQFADYS